MKVKQVTDTSFRKYGKILTGIDFSEIYNVLEKIKYPETVEYAASFGPLEEPDFRQKISNTLYGELSVEIGYCCGHNKVLNALEYHRSRGPSQATSLRFMARMISSARTIRSIMAEISFGSGLS